MLDALGEPSRIIDRDTALSLALRALSVGAREALKRTGLATKDSDDDLNPLRDIDEADADRVFLRDELKNGSVEVGVLERRAGREGRFHLLTEAELAGLVAEYK